MKKKVFYIYDMGDGWSIEISSSTDGFDGAITVWDAWITLNTIGIKSYMFGVEKNTETLDSFSALACANFDTYKQLFRDNYM